MDEVDHWLDLDPSVCAHLMTVAQSIGKAQQQAFAPLRVGMMIAGLEVPHVHLHVVPIRGMHDMDFANVDTRASGVDLDKAAESVRQALRELGCSQVV